MNEQIDLSKTGVYCITNTRNGKRYVGSTSSSFANRWRQHRNHLVAGTHRNLHLQRAWNRDQAGSFIFSILLCCEPAECIQNEQRFIDEYRTVEDRFGYNINPTAGSRLGTKHSEATKAKMRGRIRSEEHSRKLSEALKGRTSTAEQRAKQSAALKGRAQSAELIAKRAASLRGRKLSPEHVEKIAAQRRGKKQSPEVVRKRVEAMRGKPRRFSQATIDALRERNRSREWTDEARDKISAAQLGRKQSAETVAKRVEKTRGQKRSQEFRDRVSARPRTAEEIAKSAAARRGAKRTPEQIENVRRGMAMAAQRRAEGRAA